MQSASGWLAPESQPSSPQGLLHQSINLLDGSVLLGSEGEIHDRDVRGWHTSLIPMRLFLEIGYCKATTMKHGLTRADLSDQNPWSRLMRELNICIEGRKAIPVNLPLVLGSTSPTALAAPETNGCGLNQGDLPREPEGCGSYFSQLYHATPY